MRCFRTIGLMCGSFCLGVLLVLIFPAWLIAVIEALIICWFGYCGIFRR